MEYEKICIKCGHDSEENLTKFDVVLCSICHYFAPDDEKLFQQYVNEKIDGSVLDLFRKFSKVRVERQKQGMVRKAETGKLMSRAPFGYEITDGKLIPAQNSREVEEIFEEFLNNNLSLRQLAQKHNLSVNGLKKILKNFTYLGKIKFNNQIYNGNHEPLVSSTLFNHVQNKLEKMKIK